jgi:hypothetical protein
MFVTYFMLVLTRDAYRLLLIDFSDKLDDNGAGSMRITNMVSNTMLFYETDVIKDNKIKGAHSSSAPNK